MNEIPSQATDKLSGSSRQNSEATGSGDATPQTVAGGVPSAPGTEVLRSVGGYSVLGKIGEGGMGAVYLAEDTKLGRRVAIKMMRPELAGSAVDRTRFVREARAAAAVESDYIVPILHVGEAADGAPLIVMPFLQGEPLGNRLTRQPASPLGLILKVAREVSEGLMAAHAKGLIHRDIKPANIWLEGDAAAKEITRQIRRCKILDFGLARSLGGEDAHLTTSGAILGTPAYMAPEQARGERVDHRADLFSLGVTLYRMATGRIPFNGPSAMAVLIALSTETPPPTHALAPHLPPAVADLIDRLMRKDPAERPQSAWEVVAAVRAIVAELQGKRSAAGPAPSQQAPPQQPPVRLPHLPNEPALDISSSLPQPLPTPIDEKTAVDRSPPSKRRPRNGAPARRLPLRAAAAAALLALVPLGLWLGGVFDSRKVRTDDAKKDDGANAGPPVVAPKKEAPAPGPDRRAAALVLSIGGTVAVNGAPRQVADLADLPQEPFRLTQVVLADNPRASDAALAVFKDCTNLTHLGLSGTPVTDAGLANFANCRNLRVLDLHDTRVSDAGLLHLRDCKQLEELSLARTRVGDAGLEGLAGCENLKELSLSGTRVSDKGIDRIRQFKKLTAVELRETQVTATGADELARALPGCKIKRDGSQEPKVDPKADPDRAAAGHVLFVGGSVGLDGELPGITDPARLPAEPFRLTAVSIPRDAVNVNWTVFAACRNLTYLSLSDARVTDDDLANFTRCTGLEYLALPRTAGDAGLAHFRDCIALKKLILQHTQVGDAGMAVVARFAELTQLDLYWSRKVTDKGLVHLKSLPKLRILWLSGTGVTDEGLAHVAACPELNSLGLQSTAVTDAGVAHLKNEKKLRDLVLPAGVSDRALAHLRDLKELERLTLSQSAVTDAGLEHLRGLTSLRLLSLHDTKVTAKGVSALRAALPKCEIMWDGDKPGPKGK